AAAFVAHWAPFFETASPLLEALAERRPFASDAAFLAAARDVAAALPLAAQRTILDAHPAIGARRETLSAFSYREQGHERGEGAARTVAEDLVALNAAYRARHGFTFVVFVNGRSQDEILPVLRERLPRDTGVELATALAALVDIAGDRARRVRAQPAGGGA